jgi:hypothetical protein
MSRTLDLILDGLGMALEVAGWIFIVWAPLGAVCTLFVDQVRNLIGVTGILIATVAAPLIGILVRWLARGLVQRKRGRIVLLALVLSLCGISQLFLVLTMLLMGKTATAMILLVQSVGYLIGAACTFLALRTRPTPVLQEERHAA